MAERRQPAKGVDYVVVGNGDFGTNGRPVTGMSGSSKIEPCGSVHSMGQGCEAGLACVEYKEICRLRSS